MDEKLVVLVQKLIDDWEAELGSVVSSALKHDLRRIRDVLYESQTTVRAVVAISAKPMDHKPLLQFYCDVDGCPC